MVCPICSTKTKVTNNRQRQDLSIWRRRHCPKCRISFTTDESIIIESIYVKKNDKGKSIPLSRLDIYLNIYEALGSGPQQRQIASFLTQHALHNLFALQSPQISSKAVESIIYDILIKHDRLAAQRYLVNQVGRIKI